MKKTILCIIISVICFTLCSCNTTPCEHIWNDATCTAPKTCSLCEETIGKPLEHVFDNPDPEKPANCTLCGASNGVTDPGVSTYNAYFVNNNGEGDNVWEIRGVFAEGSYYAPSGFPIPLRVFYVVEQNSAILLMDLEPGEYAYRGSYFLNEYGDPCGNYDDIAPYGSFEEYTQNSQTYIRSGGYYENLPKGTWFFGSVRFSDGFIIVVGDFEAAENGTVPEN